MLLQKATQTCHTHNGMKWNRVCRGVCCVSVCCSLFSLPSLFCSSDCCWCSAQVNYVVRFCQILSSFRCICGESALKSCTTGMTVISGSYLSLYSLENSDVGLTKHYLIFKGLEACIDFTSFECFNYFDPEEIQDFLKIIVFIKGTQFFFRFLSYCLVDNHFF